MSFICCTAVVKHAKITWLMFLISIPVYVVLWWYLFSCCQNLGHGGILSHILLNACSLLCFSKNPSIYFIKCLRIPIRILYSIPHLILKMGRVLTRVPSMFGNGLMPLLCSLTSVVCYLPLCNLFGLTCEFYQPGKTSDSLLNSLCKKLFLAGYLVHCL